MWPDSVFASPTSSYNHPVPVPISDPDAAPTRTFTVSCAWLPYIRGALQQLLLQTTWRTDDPAVLLLAQQRAATLISMFTECSEGFPFACPYDFVFSPSGWSLANLPSFAPPQMGIHVGGSGWDYTDTSYAGRVVRGAAIQITFPDTRLTHIEFEYDLFKGSFGAYTGDHNQIILYHSGTQVAYTIVDSNTDPDGIGKVLQWDGDVVANQVLVYVDCDENVGFAAGSCLIRSADLRGIGATPC